MVPLFGAAYAAPNKGTTILYWFRSPKKHGWILLYMVKFKDFSRPLYDFPVLFKADLIFKDFSRQSCIFKFFSSLCKHWHIHAILQIKADRQGLIQIYHVLQDLWAFSLTDHGRTDSQWLLCTPECCAIKLFWPAKLKIIFLKSLPQHMLWGLKKHAKTDG